MNPVIHAWARGFAGMVASARSDRDRWLLGGAALVLAASFLEPGVQMEQPLFEHVVVLDVTQSMNVADQEVAGRPVSRLVFAKHMLRRSLLELPCGSQIGWGVFTEYRSFLLLAPVEVCAHLGELQSTLARIDGQMAWSGNSEVAKGLHSGIGIVKQLPHKPSLVFVTDGHEAPPLNPRNRPAFDDKPGDAKGVIVGVGGLSPAPIPKTDPLGRPLGFWRADDVMQSDPFSQGRGGSLAGEKMVVDPGAAVAPVPGAAPGGEHLSSLREGYLRQLAGELGLGYHRMQATEGSGVADALAAAMKPLDLARPVQARADLRPAFAVLALALLLARHLQHWRTSKRQRRARCGGG